MYKRGEDQTPAERAALQAHHNEQAGEIVTQIVKPIFDLGGSEGDVLVMLESIVVGVLLTMDPRGDDVRTMMLLEGAHARIGEIRAENMRRRN
jgi:hypothetical protein